jgi:uncharacterized protein YodC (DUF2158 family)
MSDEIELEIGDVVRVKGQPESPAMTINNAIDDDNGDVLVECVWFESGSWNRETFHPKVLIKDPA